MNKMRKAIVPSPALSAEMLKFTSPALLSLVPKLGLDAGPQTRILVAEDDAVSRELIRSRLAKWGYKVTATRNGVEAMTELRKKDAPSMAILDWMMPDMDGLEICRRVREGDRMVYIILLTARGSKENIIEGLRAGADDYLVKPFHADELQARIVVGLRVMTLQQRLADQVKALQAAALKINSLRLLIPL
jgi:DNA-binding response OmpR family regulator